jgi:hypothetical protein
MVTHEWTQSVYRAVDLLVRSRILLGAPVSSRPVFEPRKRAYLKMANLLTVEHSLSRRVGTAGIFKGVVKEGLRLEGA